MFSIIMPAYNAEKFIADSIRSVLLQTFEDFELIIIDDSSNDSTREIIEFYSNQDVRIKFLTNMYKKGAAGARNTGIFHATHRFICFLDSDDCWGPEKLEVQYRFMIESGCPITYSDYHVVGNGFNFSDDLNKPHFIFHAKNKVSFANIRLSCDLGCLTVAYDTNFYGKVFLPESPKEDYALWLILLKKNIVARKFPGVHAYYRLSRNSLSSNKFREIQRQALVLHEYGGVPYVLLPFFLFFYICKGVLKYKVGWRG